MCVYQRMDIYLTERTELLLFSIVTVKTLGFKFFFQYHLIILIFFIWMYPHPNLVNPLLSLDFWLLPPSPWTLVLELGVGWLPTSTFSLLLNDLCASFAY